MSSDPAAERVDLDAPREVRRIARMLEDAGFEAWAVGGAVRDAVLGLRPEDWDLTTSAHPGQVRRLFRRTVPIGIEHGTVGVLGKDGRMYEVTTFRRDVETFGRRAVVAFSERLEEDLERRDFTVNAIAWHPLRGELRDPFGGRDDLRSGVLRTVGEAADRFSEDWLRVLRALRFAGRFELRIEPGTWEAIGPAVPHLHTLSVERVREELWKVLAGNAVPSTTLQLYRDSGVLAELYPELAACVGVPAGEADLWTHLLRTTDSVRRHRPLLRLAALLHAAGEPVAREAAADAAERAGRSAAVAREVMRRLKFSNAQTDTVTHLIAQQAPFPAPDAAEVEYRRWARRVGEPYLRDLLRLHLAHCRAAPLASAPRPCPAVAVARRARRVLRERPALEIGDLAIDGGDLRRLGLPPGPLYGEILRDLLERVTDEPELNREETLLDLVRERIG